MSSRTCYTKLNFDCPYVRFLSLRRDTYEVLMRCHRYMHQEGNGPMTLILIAKDRTICILLCIFSHDLYMRLQNYELQKERTEHAHILSDSEHPIIRKLIVM